MQRKDFYSHVDFFPLLQFTMLLWDIEREHWVEKGLACFPALDWKSKMMKFLSCLLSSNA